MRSREWGGGSHVAGRVLIVMLAEITGCGEVEFWMGAVEVLGDSQDPVRVDENQVYRGRIMGGGSVRVQIADLYNSLLSLS